MHTEVYSLHIPKLLGTKCLQSTIKPKKQAREASKIIVWPQVHNDTHHKQNVTHTNAGNISYTNKYLNNKIKGPTYHVGPRISMYHKHKNKPAILVACYVAANFSAEEFSPWQH